MNSKVAIISGATTKFSERWEDSWMDLIRECGLEALKKAGIERKQISKIYCGNMGLEGLAGQSQLVSKLYEELFDNDSHIPMTRVESGEASGAKAVEEACGHIFAGLHRGEERVVVVGGVEKMKDVKSALATKVLDSTADREREMILGKGLHSLYGEIAARYLKSTGASADFMHLVSVKNHKNAEANEKAHFPFAVNLQQVRESQIMSAPLRMLDCHAMSDGASALVLVPESLAKKMGKEYVVIDSMHSATDTMSLYSRHDFTAFGAVSTAAKWAMGEAKVSPKDINVAELHDSFTITELLAYEDLGFAPRGKGFELIKNNMMNGKDAIEPSQLKAPVVLADGNSEFVFNPTGGLKARGHAIGATGVAQAVEIYEQLLGKAGKRQAQKAEVGLTHSIGGIGGTAVVGIYRAG